jgi:hypothetical protein
MKVILETRHAHFDFERIPDECYYRNASCALHLISTFLAHLAKGHHLVSVVRRRPSVRRTS